MDVLGELCLFKLAGRDKTDAVAVAQLTVPKLSGPPLPRHSREDEWFYVSTAKSPCKWTGASQRTPAVRPSVPRHPHTFQNFHDERAHILVMVTPAGLDKFFKHVTAMNKGSGQPDFARTEQLMQSYGIGLLGPAFAVRWFRSRSAGE